MWERPLCRDLGPMESLGLRDQKRAPSASTAATVTDAKQRPGFPSRLSLFACSLHISCHAALPNVVIPVPWMTRRPSRLASLSTLNHQLSTPRGPLLVRQNCHRFDFARAFRCAGRGAALGTNAMT